MSESDSIPAKAGSDVGESLVRPPELPEEAVLLRIFLGEDDRYRHLPLYEAIVLKAREKRLAGATVLRGPLGFGKSSHMHATKILRLSSDLPMVIEIVDTPEKISAFLPELDGMMKGGLVTLERAQVIRYKHARLKRLFG
jgi:PII-like signaling protein